MKKVCVITGTRAEYGLLKPLISRIDDAQDMELQLVVTGMHLSPEFGLTYREVEQDGFQITDRNEMLLSSDTPSGITKSVGLAVIGFADIFSRNVPDMIVILGDRYEIFAAATAAMIHRIPIAHIHGGELTEGLIDDAIRHAVTKMSMLHFTSTEQYRERVIQLGEHPERVFCVGALGVENIKNQKLLSKDELEESIHFSLDHPYVVVTYHPVTLEKNSAEQQVDNLFAALDKFPEYRILFTKANADTDGRIINEKIDQYVDLHKDRSIAVASLGMVRYLSTLKYCDMVIGNSSSGLLEAPSFHIPTVNIGERQRGRVRGKSVLDCGYSTEEIVHVMRTAILMSSTGELENERNPYEGAYTSESILRIIREYLTKDNSIDKKFYDIERRK